MPAVINVGGSLTGAFAVIAVAWGVRTLRRSISLKRQARAESCAHAAFSDLGAFFAPLTAEAVRILLDTDPTAHYAIDVRSAQEAEEDPLPPALSAALHIPDTELSSVLTQREAWQELLGPERVPPTPDHLLVFVAESEERMHHAAGLAASLGFPRTAILQGGVSSMRQPPANPSQAPLLSRDGLSVLLGRAGPAADAGGAVPRATVLDLRRHDERTLYGSIPGTMHLPVDQFASALALSPEAFREAYHFDKPHPQELLVLQCRTNRRSKWAAQLASDAGWGRPVVFKEGTYGWRLDASVKAYPSYEPWEAPPDPEPFTPTQPDVAAGLQDVQAILGQAEPGGSGAEEPR